MHFSGEGIFRVFRHFVGNKAKVWISERVFQENKVRQIFRKTNISYPLIRTRTCVYPGVRNVRFSENLACFVFLKHPFRDSPFCVITDDFFPQEAIEVIFQNYWNTLLLVNFLNNGKPLILLDFLAVWKPSSWGANSKLQEYCITDPFL